MGSRTRDLTLPLALAALAGLAMAAALLAMGRLPICACGYVKVWHGDRLMGPENSQHLLDWYSATHILHGIGFYWLAWLVAPRAPLAWRFAGAVGLEAAWEVFENSAMIIDRYRAVTISFDYYGDAVVNSVGDVLAMAAGFVLAARLPVAATVLVGLAIDAAVTLMIRDGFFLNMLMLVWPLDAVRAWQAGG
jgi:hypothetical protein